MKSATSSIIYLFIFFIATSGFSCDTHKALSSQIYHVPSYILLKCLQVPIYFYKNCGTAELWNYSFHELTLSSFLHPPVLLQGWEEVEDWTDEWSWAWNKEGWGKEGICSTVDQAQPLPLEGTAAHEEPTQERKSRIWRMEHQKENFISCLQPHCLLSHWKHWVQLAARASKESVVSGLQLSLGKEEGNLFTLSV